MSNGEARIVSPKGLEMVIDGPCLTATLANLEAGYGARPMRPEVLSKVRGDAVSLLEDVLQTYATNVAPGEVGASGSCRAGTVEPSSGRCPTGLLYGRVQSGKTAAMIAFSAAAIDNGFRVIVVLTTDFLKLVEQTAERFGALDGALIKSSLGVKRWQADLEHVAKHVGDRGVVFICTKNQAHLAALVEFLADIDAANYPALVLDDEADQATLDTRTRSRASGRKTTPTPPSTIYRKAVEDEEGQSIRQTLRHHVFVQVTATPYALLLQNVDNPLRPSFTYLLEPGSGYTGGEAFFSVQQIEHGDPPLILVADDESAQIEENESDVPPLGLQQAIAFFLVAAGAQNLRDPTSRTTGQNFLCHTSQKTSDHERLATIVVGYLNQMTDDLREAGPSEVLMRLHWAYDQLQQTLPDAPAFEDILARIKQRLPRREVAVVNSANSSVDFSRELNFIVGGNILGRGLTIENLLVTYYLRRAKISQMDTVLQHARMYGYRQALMPYTRVFLPEDLAARFHFIHEAEQSLRRHLAADGGPSRIIVETMTSLRATRLNVLDTNNLSAYEPGQHVFPGAPALGRNALDMAEGIERQVKSLIGDGLPEGAYTEVSMDNLVSLLKLIPFDTDLQNTWDPEMLEMVLDRIRGRYPGGFIFFRKMNRRTKTFATGVLSGPELDQARNKSAPVLCVFRDDGKVLTAGRQFWYPTLVLPSSMAMQVFNTSS
jgi:hypothetical protein